MTALTTQRTFLIVIFIGLFAIAARNVVDPDVWWHLRTGELIAARHAVPHRDPFSYTRAGQPWLAHEWLSDLLLYKLESTCGFAALIVTFAAVITAAFVLLYLRCRPASYIAGVATLLAAWATIPIWGVRPQVLSLLLTSLWLYILERSRIKPVLLFWTLPITLLWVNLHAGFALGLAISAIYSLGWAVEHIIGGPQQKPSWRTFAIVLLCDLALVSLNPNGFRLIPYAWQTLRSPAMQTYIAEWASPNFHHAEHWPLMFIILLTFATLFFSSNRIPSRDLILLLVGLFAGLASVRMIPFFVLVAVPPIVRRLGDWPRPRHHSSAPVRTALNAVIVLAIAAFTAVHTYQVVQRQPQAEAQLFPAHAVEYLQRHPSEGPIFNHYDWGGYLIWKLPATPVFIDGRADVYGESVFDDFAAIYQLKPAWLETLERWRVKSVIVPANSPLATALRSVPGWFVTYQDNQATILAYRSP